MSGALLIRGYRGLQVRDYIEPQMTLCLGVRSITNCSNGIYRLGGKERQKDKLPPSRG